MHAVHICDATHGNKSHNHAQLHMHSITAVMYVTFIMLGEGTIISSTQHSNDVA